MKKYLAIIIPIILLVLLCRTWTWSAPFPSSFTLTLDILDNVGEKPQFAKVDTRLNSEKFISNLRDKLSHHYFTKDWKPSNIQARSGLINNGKLIITFTCNAYGIQRWSLLRQGSGVDKDLCEKFEVELTKEIETIMHQNL